MLQAFIHFIQLLLCHSLVLSSHYSPYFYSFKMEQSTKKVAKEVSKKITLVIVIFVAALGMFAFLAHQAVYEKKIFLIQKFLLF